MAKLHKAKVASEDYQYLNCLNYKEMDYYLFVKSLRFFFKDESLKWVDLSFRRALAAFLYVFFFVILVIPICIFELYPTTLENLVFSMLIAFFAMSVSLYFLCTIKSREPEKSLSNFSAFEGIYTSAGFDDVTLYDMDKHNFVIGDKIGLITLTANADSSEEYKNVLLFKIPKHFDKNKKF